MATSTSTERPRALRTNASRFALAALALCATAACPGVTRPEAQQGAQPADRVIAFADVHGAYAELTELLRAAGIADAGLHWSAGRTRVVSLGDLLDRGADSRRIMDLVMRLQGEAQAAGGSLQVVLGNHEAMNLLGDLRYVAPADFAAYAAGEPADLRERARAGWQGRSGQTAAEFDTRFPPGWFARRAAFAADGVYGRWLLGLPVAIVIGDTLFMHGGPSPVLAGLSLDEINLRYRAALADYLAALAPLEAAGLVQIEDAYEDRAAAVRQRLAAADPALRARLTGAVEGFAAADGSAMLGVDGPNWYRGAALCNACSESDVLRPVLEGLRVARLVIGHTVAHGGRVATRFDGAVIKLDAGMNHAVFGGHPAALVLAGGGARVLYADSGGAEEAIPAEPLYIAPAGIPDADVAALLTQGAVTVVGPRSPGMLDVQVEAEGRRTPAVFIAAGAAALNRELAAYRLDRLLALGLVPATVVREVQGQRGYLQARPTRWVTQADVQRESLRPGGWCAVAPQLELVYAFDALIGNGGRTAERVLYDAAEWNVLLTGHDRAFGRDVGLPEHLRARPPVPGAELRRRLAALDDAALAAALGDVLDARERAAILKRRDGLLTRPAGVAAAGAFSRARPP